MAVRPDPAPVRGSPPEGPPAIGVDRIRCTGHGVCAAILPGTVDLDEWGYPVVGSTPPPPRDVARAIKLCPANALYRV